MADRETPRSKPPARGFSTTALAVGVGLGAGLVGMGMGFLLSR